MGLGGAVDTCLGQVHFRASLSSGEVVKYLGLSHTPHGDCGADVVVEVVGFGADG